MTLKIMSRTKFIGILGEIEIIYWEQDDKNNTTEILFNGDSHFTAYMGKVEEGNLYTANGLSVETALENLYKTYAEFQARNDFEKVPEFSWGKVEKFGFAN